MITSTLPEYEALALKLANNPAALSELKLKLARNRNTLPLFDTAAYTRNLEMAYRTMSERLQAGQPPKSFSVERPQAPP